MRFVPTKRSLPVVGVTVLPFSRLAVKNRFGRIDGQGFLTVEVVRRIETTMFAANYHVRMLSVYQTEPAGCVD